MRRLSRALSTLAVCLGVACLGTAAAAPDAPVPDDSAADDLAQAPPHVEIEPVARDHEIRERLLDILRATGWFRNEEVRVQDGVVFLDGLAGTKDQKEWAANLARSTRDVAVVVNRMGVAEPPLWDFEPALNTLRGLWRGVLRALPVAVFSALILTVSWLLARLTARVTRRLSMTSQFTPFLRAVVARAAACLVFILGLYIVLRIAGLTTVALTVMGGTGLLGLVLGIAFRSIIENFLASIFLNIQKPFRNGDLVEIAECLGYVQRLTSRVTVLMTLDGNHMQIPNTTVYRSAIRNFTSNPNRREDFSVGIGYGDAIVHAQSVALEVLSRHPAVLADPEPWVLVDSLGKATVNLRIFFWLDGSQHSWLKVRSSVIRLVKRAFQAANISMPDEARELVFPEGVPVQLVDERRASAPPPRPRGGPPAEVYALEAESEVSATAEGGLSSEAAQIENQARRARTPEGGQDLL